MTLEFYKHEEDRITSKLLETTPGTDEYQALLSNLGYLMGVSVQSLDAIERLAFAEENEASNAPMNIVPLTPVPEPEPEPEPEDPAITFDELKTRFTKAARSGVKVGEIIEDFGFTKLSDAPPEKYSDLLKALEEKAGVT